MNEDKTSYENDELEANQSENEYDSSDESDATSNEEQGGTDDDSSSDDGRITLTKEELEAREREIRKEQDKRWKERLKNAEKGDEGGEESRQSSNKTDNQQTEVASDDRYDRLELKMDGITSKEAQDTVIDYARFKGISVSEAANTPVVKAELKELEQKSATPAPGNRTGHTDRSDDLNYWIEQQKKGKSAPTAEMRRKVRMKLSGR